MPRLDFKRRPTGKFKPLDKLSKREAREEVEALREGIQYHDHLYYVRNKPAISDALYDKLFRRLQELEDKFRELQSDTSPTRRVGETPHKKVKHVEHAAPMLSLHNVTGEAEVTRFHEFVKRQVNGRTIRYFLEPKFDGVSVELVYERGEFHHGVTRGDGQTGDDISGILKTANDFPMRLRRSTRAPRLLAVRGEAYLSKATFQQLNRERLIENLEPFANPRNAAAGILHRLDAEFASRWPLDVVVYDVLKVDGAELKTQHEARSQLGRWGFKVSEPAERTGSLEAIRKYHHRMESRRDKFPVEIDGIVVKVDDLAAAARLGVRHRSPRWAVAWKFEPREEVTTLEEIIVQVGKSGSLTPVALLAPVDVGGVTVSRATLHNESEVRRKDVRSGDKVRIKRAGDVIPEVVERVKTSQRRRGRQFSMPQKCPVCGTKVVKEGANYFCPAGIGCSAQLIGCLTHYASREALNIKGLGDETARQLVEHGVVKDVADLYRLKVKDLKTLEHFADISAQNLYDAIQDSRRPRLDRFLYALAIRHVGRRTAGVIAREFVSLEKLQSASEAEIARVVGPVAARSIRRFFEGAANKKVLRRLQKFGVKVQDMLLGKETKILEGKTFVFTGGLAGMTREEAQEAVEARGGQAASSVSRNTDYVVVGKRPGSKLSEARKVRATILDESGFRKLLGA